MKQLFRLFFLLITTIICVAIIGCDIITGFEEGSFPKSNSGKEKPAEAQTEPKEFANQSSELPTPGNSGEAIKEIPKSHTNQKRYSAPPPMTITSDGTYSAYVRTNKGDMTIELFAAETPVTVNNFVFLSNEGFYNGVRFHRIMKEFMIQTGDPRGDGTGGPGYRFEDERISRAYNKGTVAMANSGPNTNGSQFFIVHGANVGLPPMYTIFGQVTKGIEVVDAIANVPVERSKFGREISSPTSEIIIETVEIMSGG